MRAEAGLDPLLVIVMRLQGFDQPILNQASGLYKRQDRGADHLLTRNSQQAIIFQKSALINLSGKLIAPP
jgi:hypothetical protein